MGAATSEAITAGVETDWIATPRAELNCPSLAALVIVVAATSATLSSVVAIVASTLTLPALTINVMSEADTSSIVAKLTVYEVWSKSSTVPETTTVKLTRSS